MMVFVLIAAGLAGCASGSPSEAEVAPAPPSPVAPEPAAAAPLTAAEQQRFEAGRELYRGVCAACHRADGTGVPSLGASLVNSRFVIGPATVPVRVLLNGKLGSIGMMPPLGASFTDEQVASVLTYIRRDWGHTASAIDPAFVRDARAAASDRTSPWTAEELDALTRQGSSNPR